jgi:hypothetical protein
VGWRPHSAQKLDGWLRNCAKPKSLAALIVGADMDQAVSTPWYGYDMTRTAGNLCALVVYEALVHGWDLTGALGPWRRLCHRS